jgi:uncharacterized protein
MPEIRPNCEICEKYLPSESTEARIRPYDYTYCANCAESILHNVCAICGGGFAPRPIRPPKAYRFPLPLGLAHHFASQMPKQPKWSREEIGTFVNNLRSVPPKAR